MQLFPDSAHTIEGVSRLIANGEMTCEDVVRNCLTRIDERESEIAAWVVVDRDGASQAARVLDSELNSGGPRSPLHGIPVGIKDIFDVEGFPTAAGFAPWQDRIAREDAEVVRRLRAAGAIILGKTVTTQFACYDPPVTRNPWNLDRTPGGSSSGSAAAVAAGMCFAAIGSQTGGSITRPASFCGIAGCKPTFGLVSRRGVVPIAEHLDHVGPMARSVADLALVLDVISGFDSCDAYSREAADDDLPDLAGAVHETLAGPHKIGRLNDFFEAHTGAESVAACMSAIESWTSSGAKVVDVGLPVGFADVVGHHRRVMACEGATYHEKRIADHPSEYLPGIRALVEEGLANSLTDYVRSRAHQTELARAMSGVFADVDVLVCAATVAAAPSRSTTGDPILNAPWSYTGLPVVSIPVALNSGGLPLSVQFIGRPFDEFSLFCIARWCESIIHGSPSPPTK